MTGSTNWGIDFGIVYPTAGLGIPRIGDDETRRAVIRGFNIVTADYFAKLSDRLTPAAVIPMHTPKEAIAELEFVTKELGSKVGMFGSGVAGRCQSPRSGAPRGSIRKSRGMRCSSTSSVSTATTTTTPSGKNARNLESRRPSTPAAAASDLRNNPSNFTFNHIAHFAAAGHAVAKGLFLGGVTRRFPDLRFGFS